MTPSVPGPRNAYCHGDWASRTTLPVRSGRDTWRVERDACVAAEGWAASRGTARGRGGGWSSQPVSCPDAGRVCNPRQELPRPHAVSKLCARPRSRTATAASSCAPWIIFDEMYASLARRSIVSDQQLAEVHLEPHAFHGEWNDTIHPAKAAV